MNGNRSKAIYIALIAVFSGILTGGKLALTFLPNIEIVTLTISLISTVFGLFFALPVTLIFVTVDILLYGINYWLIAYYIYWPMLAVVFYFFGRKGRKPLTMAVTAAFMTLIFGVITTLLDTAFLGGLNGNFLRIFGVYYARGILFFIVHIVSNFIIILLLYKPLRIKLSQLKEKLLFR